MSSIFCTPMSVGLMGRPSSLAKVGWMALTSLSELSKASCHCHRDHTGHQNWHLWLSWPYWPWNQHSFFRNQTGYQMQGTHSKVDFLAPVTKAEVVKTVASLLRCCSFLAWDILSLLKQMRWLRSLRAILTIFGALVRSCFKWHCFAENLSRTAHLEDPK